MASMVMVLAAVIAGQSAQEQLSQLAWMVGSWKGTGWQESGGKRTEITCREIVEFKAGGSVIAITDYQATKAPGESKFGPEREAYFQITFEAGKFVMRGYTTRGLFATFEPKPGPKSLEWSYAQVPIRMHLSVDDAGTWIEKGYRKTGETEAQEFELVLKKST